MSTRQSLADRLRHGKVKFLYDPAYTAAKKKPLSEQQAEIYAFSKPLPTAEIKEPKLSKIFEANAVSMRTFLNWKRSLPRSATYRMKG